VLTLFAMVASSAMFWWNSIEVALHDAEVVAASALDTFALASVSFVLLPVVGFAAGVLASFSPCILPLVPLNVAYVGAHEATGWRSLGLSLRFVAGAAAVLSLLGIFGDVAGLLLVEHRGIMLVVVGLALIYFGLVVSEAVPDLFMGRGIEIRRRLGPFGAGAAFSMVTTPCSSPILGAVLAAAAAHSVPGLGVGIYAARFSGRFVRRRARRLGEPASTSGASRGGRCAARRVWLHPGADRRRLVLARQFSAGSYSAVASSASASARG
jgi:cytochrome c biogenesis protein CcdA